MRKKKREFGFLHLFSASAFLSLIFTLLFNMSEILNGTANYFLMDADFLFFMYVFVLLFFLLVVILVAKNKIEFKGIKFCK